MIAHVCPWWLAPIALNMPLRRFLHNPGKIVGPYMRPGMTVLDVGCGVGWFSIPMAGMVGASGKVIAVDLQPQMLAMLRRRAEKAGMTARIETHECEQNRLNLHVEADFALAFAMVHEVPDPPRLLDEIRDCLKPGGRLLLAEPPLHVPRRKFADEVASAEAAGLRLLDRPRLRWSHAAIFGREN